MGQPYSSKIEQTDGSVMSCGSRERPKIAFKGRSGVTPESVDDIVPVALYTAVNPNCGGRDKDQPGTDWTVHHIQPIGDDAPTPPTPTPAPTPPSPPPSPRTCNVQPSVDCGGDFY